MWCERILRHVVWLWWWRNHLLTVGVNVPTDVRPVNNQSCRNNRRPSPVCAMKTHQRLFTVCVSYKLAFSLVLFVRLVTYLRILPSLDRHAHLPTAYPETQLVIVFWHILFPTTLVSRWSNHLVRVCLSVDKWKIIKRKEHYSDYRNTFWLPVYLKRSCSCFTSTSSTLGILNDYAL